MAALQAFLVEKAIPECIATNSVIFVSLWKKQLKSFDLPQNIILHNVKNSEKYNLDILFMDWVMPCQKSFDALNFRIRCWDFETFSSIKSKTIMSKKCDIVSASDHLKVSF